MIEFATLSRKSTVVDVGAFVGETSKKYCEFIEANPKHFHLIEPHPRNFKTLRKGMPGYSMYNLAISDHDGLETLYSDLNHLNASSLYVEMPQGKGGKIQEHTVPCMTMDSFLQDIGLKKIDLMMVNCEGAELKMFGAPSTGFLAKTTYLMISFHGKRQVFPVADKRRINTLLSNSGFRWVDGVPPNQIGEQEAVSHEMQLWKRD